MKYVKNSVQISKKDYLEGKEYQNGILESIYHSDGRVIKTGPTTFIYEYHLKDHLGNIRVSFVDDNNDGMIVGAERRSLHDYYAYGMEWNGTWRQNENTGTNNHRYNGKEEMKEMNSNLLLYGARQMDVAIGRFNKIDPLSTKYFGWSTYNYVMNNPIQNVDPNGTDVYLFYWVKSENANDNSMFFNAALTRAINAFKDMKSGDIYRISQIRDLGQLKSKIAKEVTELSPQYGATKEFGLWSHSGLDGPIGSVPTSSNALHENGSPQLSLQGWSGIDFNWNDCESGSNASFYGCNSAKDPDDLGPRKSFSENISNLPNFRNVEIGGQPFSSYPSMYSNLRETNANMRDGNFYKQETYMVASGNLGIAGRYQPTYSYPMRFYINGKMIESRNQKGREK